MGIAVLGGLVGSDVHPDIGVGNIAQKMLSGVKNRVENQILDLSGLLDLSIHHHLDFHGNRLSNYLEILPGILLFLEVLLSAVLFVPLGLLNLFLAA